MSAPDLQPSELIVDSFAGGGGASEGIRLALGRDPDIAINHDAEAIAMHRANHPTTLHLTESVWAVDPVEATAGRPVGLMWLSPDCKHFSKAKGGKPVDKKIRGLAWVAVRWAKAVRPRVIVLENVEEFRTWGPVLSDGRPCPRRRGATFLSFRRRLERLGYVVEARELRASDYGAPTIRRRLFLVARCDGRPIMWPQPTHGPNRPLPWRTAAECIDFSIPCPSIFERKKPLAEATLRRIARGLKLFVIDSPRPFIIPLTHHGENRGQRIEEPLATITAAHRGEQALVVPRLVAAFLAKHYSDQGQRPGLSLFEPLSTVTSVDHHALAAVHLSQLNGTSTGATPEQPLGSITAQGNHFAEVRAFLVAYYGNEQDGGHLLDPLRTLSTRDRFGLVTVDGSDYLIADIGMRMLQPRELFNAQGFRPDYQIDIEHNGKRLSKTAQVRLVGNSVCPPIAAAIVRANVILDENADPREMEAA